VKISDALLKITDRKNYLRRKAWNGIFIEVCNDVLYIHSGLNDPLGREWKPIRLDLIQTDWEVTSKPTANVWPSSTLTGK
jgi:hypothetical protein